LGDLTAEELRKLPQLPAVLALPHGVTRGRLRDAAGVAYLDQDLESVERQPAFGKESFKHD